MHSKSSQSGEPMASRLVLVVEADPAAQRHAASLVTSLGYEAFITESVEEALAALSHNEFLLSLVDLDLDGADGIEVLRRLRIQGGRPGPIVIIANSDSIKRVSEAAALGADDVLQTPFTPDDLENTIKSAIARPPRVWGHEPQDDRGRKLQHELALWQSAPMREVREIIRQAARADVTVLICGETGTGKDLVARAIHEFGVRKAGPFVKVNCAAVPRELLESELFGHERGAFTGAHQLKLGKFESADRGTIFLDEIGDLHPALQGKLLHVLQDGQFSRVGGRSTIKVDVRVLAATNQNLEQAVAAGRFRDDLYYRLNVVQIVVPALRERPEEIPILAQYFVERYAKVFQHEGFELPAETVERLRRYRYPGNVRELENIVKRMIVLGDSLLARSSWPGELANGKNDGAPPPAKIQISLKDISRKAALVAERQAILNALEQTQWNRMRAAKLLNISYRALLYKIKDAALVQDGQSSRPA
jgi:two-component system response regulator AtoC